MVETKSSGFVKVLVISLVLLMIFSGLGVVMNATGVSTHKTSLTSNEANVVKAHILDTSFSDFKFKKISQGDINKMLELREKIIGRLNESDGGKSYHNLPEYNMENSAVRMEHLSYMNTRIDFNNNATPMIDGHATGLILPDRKELENLIGHKMIIGLNTKVREPSSVRWDLDPHFPPVGDQEWQGSCTAWAVSYYQNGFLQRMIYNWTDDSLGHLMSPSWTYNKANFGEDGGSTFEGNIEVIESVGDATLANMTYNPSDYVSWGDENAWRDAPKHRIGNYYLVYFGNDSGIATIKELLQEGYLVTFGIDASQFGNGFADGNYIISSQEYNSNSPNHAQTIVGYDDNITDDGDVGAFRVVNSWGTDWGDHGFYWITYKALEEKISQGWPYARVLVPLSQHPYNPKLLAIWHFSNPGPRDAPVNITIGSENSSLYRTPIWNGGNHYFPSFMALDITEFYNEWVNSSYKDKFYLKIGSSSSGSSTVDSFKIDYYPYGYKYLWQNSTESRDVPAITPLIIKSAEFMPSEYFPYIYINPIHTIFHKYYHLNVTDVILGNAGNSTDALLFYAEATNGWSVHPSYKKIVLRSNEIQNIELNITPPNNVKLGDKTTIKIKVISQNDTSKSYMLNIKEIYLSNIIYIDGDSDFKYQAKIFGWPGNGSEDNPYIISGHKIDASNISFGIYIRNTRVHFIVTDCEIYHSSAYYSWPTPYGEGVWLYNVWYAKIYNNIFHNNGNHTLLRGGDGIFLQYSLYSLVFNNIVYNNWNGITLYYSYENIIKSNIIKNNGESGISILSSGKNSLYHNNMTNNGIFLYGGFNTYITQKIPINNTINGKSVFYYINSNHNFTAPPNIGEIILGNVSNLKIENTTLLGLNYGIQIAYSSNVTIINSTVEGISIQGSNNITVDNTHCEGGIDGVVTMGSSKILIKNSTFKNKQIGVYFFDTEKSIAVNNTFYDCESGIEIVFSSNNLVKNNHIVGNYNEDGIYVYYSQKNSIENNTIYYEKYGVFLNRYSKYNILIYNTISKSSKYGVYMASFSEYNIIYNNSFYYNHGSGDTYNSSHIQARDDGSDNWWNSTSGIGNYWQDWANNNNSNDKNGDGIVDWPYNIDGSAGAKDYYPLRCSVEESTPSHPFNLNAKTGNGYVNLSWNQPLCNGSSNITLYKIYRNGTLIATVPATQLWYNDTNVVPGVNYSYYVTAVNSVGESQPSNTVKATPTGAIPEFSSAWIAIITILSLLVVFRRRKVKKT
ncbi:right-handed parallel beta-helix repeat-containing protein [Candidatus Aciduliprofundum boonei]|uniref:Fibronectin type III domain protein n=1 Tax=Aciduliprofundum boonei (strain DSM 19572 / T469) TaxID=439481 RepID=B5IFT4_ACIB4|nr:Fibronectin type III domain protein [Aciduliprofundum boonei T469]EDY34221.1 Fibronectin type III domain protein [Aciduliprofundum boonei T469]EDY34920.1 Fibronectin type III domain protein [Aciduliprofundum boonei T469]